MYLHFYVYIYTHTRIYKFRHEFHRHFINLSLESSHVSCSAWRPVLLSRASFLICLFELSSVCQGCEGGRAISQKHSQKIAADAPLAVHAWVQPRVGSWALGGCGDAPCHQPLSPAAPGSPAPGRQSPPAGLRTLGP